MISMLKCIPISTGRKSEQLIEGIETRDIPVGEDCGNLKFGSERSNRRQGTFVVSYL